MKDVKIIKKHRKNCDAVRLFEQGTWNTSWAYLENVQWIGYTRYWEVKCNDGDCKGRARVSEKKILELVDSELLKDNNN